MLDEKPVTSLLSITAILLKEIRLERGVHQAQVADYMSKSASTIAKIENGQMILGLDTLMAMCGAHNLVASYVLAAAERYSFLFSNHGWVVLRSPAEQDSLMPMAIEYYGSLGFKRRQQNQSTLFPSSILNGPSYLGNQVVFMPDVFRFCLEQDFRLGQLTHPIQTFQ